MFDWIFSAAGWLQFATLLLLEIILGIDNIIFLSLITNALPDRLRARARFIGLALALIARLGFLSAIFWLSKLTAPLFSFLGNEISGRDLVLIIGGVFLMVKSLKELVQMISAVGEGAHIRPPAGFFWVLVQIVLIDLIFSIDSVITAVGIAEQLGIMMAAVVLAVVFMMFASAPISRLIERFVQLKILALAFLVMVGGVLLAEGLDCSIARGYIYAALGFSLAVCALEIACERRRRGD